VSLSDEERRTLAAMLERLIPGAGDAGVIRYVERAASAEPDLYAGGLGALAGLADLAPEEQDERLSAIEHGEFFELVRLHAIQGMFGDPSHGGNAGGMGWTLLGFPGPKGTFGPEDQQLR
jgi:gluconate 2-dehydrogenase gamma chain